jgi:tape measure domain-containing protein
MNDLVLALKLTTQGGQLVVKDLSTVAQASRNASHAVADLGQSGTQASAGVGQTSMASQKLTQEAGRATAELNTMHNRMLAMAGASAVVFAAFQSFQGVKALIERADDFNVLQQRIRTATAETNDYNTVSAEMYAIAQRNGAALAPTVELFQRLSTSRKDLKATNAQMLDFTDAVQKLGVIGGSSTSALEAGLMQLSQGLSGGVLRAEEFNSLLENIPEVASRIGKGMDDIGKSENELGLGDLRKLVLEGKLLSDDVLKSILVQLPEIEKQFGKMPVSVGRAGTMLDNSFSAALSRVDEVTGATQAWADVLVSISKTLDGMSASELQNASATLLAIAGGAGALLFLSRYNIGLKAIGATSAGLTLTLLQKTAALMGVSTAAGVATGKITALGVASAAASRAMALLGGPIGLAVLAGFAIYEFAQNSDLGAEKADLLTDRLNKLSGAYGEVSKNNLQKAVASNTKELATNADRIAEITKKMAENRKIIDGSPGSNKAQKAYREMGDLKRELAELSATQKVLMDDSEKLAQLFFDFSGATDPFAESAAKASDELLKLYNAQMLNAQAVDASGRALSGIDLELFKTQFKEATTLPKDAEAAIKQFFKTAEASQQLAANDKYLAGLKEEVRLQQVRLSQGEAEYELQKAISGQKLTDPKQLKLLQDTLALQRQINQTKTQGDALKALKAENDLLQIRLVKGEKEYQLQKLIRDLRVTDPAVIKQLDAEIERQRLLNEQLDVRKYLTDGSYDEVLDGLTKIGDAGSSVGNALVDSFGSVADQFARMAEQQDEFTKKFVTLSEARKKAEKEVDPAKRTKALEKADSTERKLLEDQARLQMGNYATLAGAASKMFSEQSKGRQVLHKLEVTFAAIETALALKKAAANALAAISNQGGGDPYSAFARIAAMAAIMAGLGIFSGSAGGGVSAQDRQKTQGTGTVMGDSDAKSESIANALGRIEDLELDQYAELRAINGSIRELSAGIKNLAVNLVASYGRFNEANYPGELGKEYNLQLGSGLASVVGGGVIGLVADKLLGGLVGGLTNKLLGGLFGSKKTELVDSGLSFAAQELGDIISSGLMNATVYDVIKTTKKKLFGLSKSTSESTEYRDVDNALRAEFARIFAHMSESVTEAVNLLGLQTNKTLESFVINLPALSFKDLKGDEIEKELQAMFSQQGDLMVQYLVPGIAEFQKIGEGLYDTLIRVAQEQAVFNSALDNLGLQLNRFAGVTKEIELEVAQSIIELMGGIEQFQSATAEYFAEFYSEQEQLAAITKSAAAQFASLGIAMPTSRDGFKDLVDSLDLTTEAGQRMFAALMALVPAMDQYYDQQERKARELAGFNKSIGDELAKLDMTDLQKSLFDLKAWYDAQIKEAAELGADTSLLEKLYDRKRAALIAAELEKATADINNTFKQLVDSIQAASAGIGNSILDIRRQMNGWDESAYQAGQVNQLRGQLGTGDITAQIKAIQNLQGAIVSRYQADISANNLLMQQAQAALDSLNASWGELTSSLAGVRSSISAAILDIRRQGSGWNEVGYQKGNISDLRSKLGAGSVLDQINTVSALQQAIVDRYNAELAANAELASAAQARYEADVAAHNALRDAAKQLLAAADSLLLSDLNPALMGDQFTEAQKQFNQLLNKARSGDADAMQQLSGVGNSYLELARDYYASGSSEYAAIFNQVQQAYRSFGGLANSAEATVPRAVLEYQQADSLLQQQSIKELEELQLLLDDLEKKAAEEKAAAEALAKAELAAYQARQLELQEGAIAELTELQTMLDQLESQAAAQRDAQLAIAQQQLDAAMSLRAGMSEIAVAIGNMPPPVVNVTVNVAAPAAASAATTAAAESVVSDLLQQQLAEQRHASELQARQMSALQDDMQRTQAMMFESRRQA